MTVETVLENVLIEIGLDIPGAQISSNDFQIRQIKAHMNAAGKDIARRGEWSRLYASLAVAGGSSSVALPADFYQMAETGSVTTNDAAKTHIRACVAPEQWAFLQNRPSTQPFYHLTQGQIHFSPAIPAEGAIIRYVSRHWVGSAKVVAQNGDELKIPESLVEKGTIWRWKRQKGLPYDDILAEFEADIIAEIKADRGVA